MKTFRNKTFRALVGTITLLATTFVYSGPPRPSAQSIDIVPVDPMYLGTINGGIKTNDSYTDGNFSIVAPVWSTLGTDDTLSGGSLFLEPYISWGEGGEVVSSLGLGYRYLFGNQSMRALTMHDGHQAGFFEEGVAIGGNIFIDMLDTEANNQLWQLGVGAELQTRYVELRGNYYIPLSNKQLAEETRTRSSFTSSSSSTSTFQGGSGVGDPYATGNTIAQDVNLATYATTTTRTTTTTIEQLFRRYEEGMEGWDAEMAVLVPGVDRYFDLRLIGGYYSFDNQPFGPQTGGTGNVEGWKAGVEVRPVPAVILNGTWYEDTRLTGSDWTVGLQLQMPFEAGDLGDGKSFWDRIGDSFKPRRRHLIERMAEPVRRQNAAIKVANSFDEDTRVVSQKSNVQRVTKVVQQTNQRLVLMDDVIFVNNGAATGNGIQAGSVAGTGTAEQPLNTIQAGANIAGTNSTGTGRVWNVYTQGGAAYAENVTANLGSVNFAGSGKLIEGQGGKSFGTGSAPSLTGGFSASNIHTFGVTGYNISGGFGGAEGVVANNITNLRMDQVVIQNAGTHGISLANLNGTAAMVNVSVNGSANNGMQVTGGNVIATLLAQNLDISGSGDAGLNFINASGTYSFDATSSIDDASGAAFRMEGGAADVTYAGNINQANNNALVAIVAGHTGDVTFQTGTLGAASGGGLLFDNADGVYNFLGTTTLTNGAKIAILNGSAGDFGFATGTSVSNGNGQGMLVDNSTADIIYAGSISQGSGSLFQAISHSTGTVAFTTTSNLSATGGEGLFFNNADGTYQFLGTTTLNGGDAGVDLVNGSDGTFAFGAGTSITNPSGNAFFVNGGNSNVTYAGSITDNSGFAVQILNHGTGTVTFAGAVASTAGGNGIQLLNNAGTFQFASVTATSTGGNAIHIENSTLATHTFADVSITSPTGRGVALINAGTVNLLDGSINGTGAEGIFSQNTALMATSLTIGDNTSLATPTFGIVVQNTDGTARVVNLSDNSIRAQIHGISTTDSGVAGELTLILNGNTYESTLAAGNGLNVVGSGTDSTTIRSMTGGTVIGNGTGGGINFERVTFDADGATAGNQAVAAGDWSVGQGISNRVFGDGARFINPTGELTFGALNIFNDNGAGLHVDTDALGTNFVLNSTSGSIDTMNGIAMLMDSLTVNLTFSGVSSTNSSGSGIYLDEVAGSLNLGNVTVANSAHEAYVQEDSTVAVTAGVVNITNAGGAGMVFSSAGGSFTAGETRIDGFQGTGIDFTGSGVNATFGVTTISKAFNNGADTGIDLSGTTGNSISFAAGSSISNVAVGVELSASGTTATSANALFVFGDGEGDINKLSSINATTTVNAIGLAATGVYDFDDVNFTGTAGFPASAGSAMFVSATATNGAGNGSFLNPYSVHDADAITTGGTFAFLDGSYDFALLNGGLAFTLSNGQSVTGLDNGAAVVYGTTQPINVLGDFGMLGGTATRAGNGTLAIVNSGSANVFEMQGANSIYNLTVNGSANTSALFSSNAASGIVIYGVTATGLAPGNTALSFSNMTGNVSVQGNNINASAGTLLSINGGNATYSIVKGVLPDPASTVGTLTGGNVNISTLTGGTVNLTGASITNLNITGTSGGSVVNVNDAAIAAVTGSAVNISNSAGAVNFNAATIITGGTGVAFNVSGGSGNIIHNGTLTQNHAATAVRVADRTGGAVTFGGAITASTSTATAIHLANNGGSAAINFNGGLSINTTTATAFVASGGGLLNVAAGPSVTINTTEGGLGLQFSNINLGSATFDSINVADGLSSGTNGAVNINGVFGGSLSIGDISVERVLVDAISITNVAAGTYAFTGLTSVTSTFMGANAIDVSNTAAGVNVSFANLDITTVNGGAAVLLNNNAGAISFTGGQINRVTGGDAINSTNSNLTVSNVLIGNNSTWAVSGRGINVANTGANVSTVTLTNNNIRSGAEAIRTTDSATGTLLLNVSGNTLQTTGAGVKTVHIAGAALNSTIITGFNGGTVIGNGAGGGVFIDRATFDSDAVTAGIQQVSAGGWFIGQSTGARVSGDGLNFINPTGDLSFGLLNIFNANGTGLLVDAKLTTFTLGGAGSGTVNTSGGTALNLDPLTANLNFGTVVSNNSGAGNPGVILDGVAGSVTIGSLAVDISGADGLVVQNSSANVTFGNVFISNTGGDGIHLAGNTGSFQTSIGGSVTVANAAGDGIDLTGLTANPTVNMLSTVNIADFGGIGVNFTGANVTAAFGVTTISNSGNGSTGTAIDLSSTTGTRNITFAAGSAISNVSIGVQIGATSGTAANANFVFGDGMSSNGLQSSISATTTVAALGLDPAPNSPGVYNFNDVSLTGTPLFPGAPGGAVFVSASALNSAGDGSLANPYSIADADALTGTLTFGFLDGSYNFAALGANGFTVAANQSVAGLDNGAGISYGVLQPNRVLGNFGVLGGTATRANTSVTGTLSITNGLTGSSVFTLFGSNTVSNITLTGEGGAQDPLNLIQSDGLAAGFNNTAGISIQGVSISNVQSTSRVMRFANMTGNVVITDNNINASGGQLLDVAGGTGNFTISKGTGTLTGRSIAVANTAGGFFSLTGASLSTVGNTAVTLNGNAAAVNLLGLAVTRTAGDTAFNIDATVASTSAVIIGNSSTLDGVAGRAFVIGAGARDILAPTLHFTNAGSTVTVIQSTSQTGGTISLGNVGVTGFNNAASTAVTLAGTGGTVTFGDLDIATNTGAGLNVGAVSFRANGTPTISATGATALTFNGTTIDGGTMNFQSVASTGGVNGISMTNVTGTTGFNLATISGSIGDGVFLSNAGTVHLRDGSINNVGGHGVNMLNTGGSIGRFNNVDIGTTGTVAGNGINVLMNDAVARTVDIFTVNVGTGSNVAGKGIFYTQAGSAAQQLFIESSGVNSIGNGVEVVKNSTGNLEFRLLTSSIKTVNGAALTVNGATGTGTLFVTQQSGNDFTVGAGGGVLYNTVTFDSNLGTAGFQEVDDGYFETLGTATSAGRALSFTNVSGALGFDTAYISNTNGSGLFSNSNFALRISGGSVDVTNGGALTITNTALNLTFDVVGPDVRATNAPQDAVFIGAGTTGTVNLGEVVVNNALSSGIRTENSAANISASTIQVNGAQYGLYRYQNTGTFTVSGATTIQNVSNVGMLIDQSAATFTGATTVSGGVVGMALYGTGAKSFGTVNVSGASNVGIRLGAVNLVNSGAVTFGTTTVNVLAGATNGILATGFSGTGTFGETTIGTAATAGSGGVVGLGMGTGVADSGSGGSLTFASLGITQTTTGISSAGHLTDLTVTGPTTITNTSTTGISITGGANAAHIFSFITIAGPTATGIRFGSNTGIFTASGTTTLTGITGTGIDANAATGIYNFGALTIGYSGAGRGIDFRDSNVRFETNNFTLTGNNTAGSIGIDLSGSLNPNGANSATANILLAKDAGETAAISGVATGVKLGDATDGSAGANFVYGNQTPVNSGSSIAVTAGGTTIDTSNLTSTDPFTQGRYEFRGVQFTGQATFEGINPNYIFVGTNAAGSANGSNPDNRISTATFLANYNTTAILANKTVVFVNDNVAGINLGGSTLNLGANTVLAGFGNGATVTVLGGVQPVNVIGDTFVPGGGTFSDAAGAATVLSNAGISTLTLNATNTLSNFILGNGGTSIVGTNFGTLTVNGMVINNALGSAINLNTGALAGTGFNSVTSGGGVNAILLTNVSGSLNFGTGSLTGASGATFAVSGGTIALNYSGSMTQGSNAALLSVSGGHSVGTLQFQTGTLSTTNGTGLQFDNADGSYNFNGATTLNGGSSGVDILNGSSGIFTFGTGASIANASGLSFDVENSSANITYNGTIAHNHVGNAVVYLNNTGGTSTFGGLITANTASSTAILLTGNAGATISFNGGLNITSSSHGLSASGGGTLSVAATSGAETITSGATAVMINNTNIGDAGVTFDSITATGANGSAGVSLVNTGSSGVFTVTGTTTVSGRSVSSIFISGTANTNFGTVNISGRTGSAVGIDISDSSGTLQFGNTTISNAGNSTGNGIRYLNSTGSATFAQTNVNQGGAAANALFLSGSNGSFTSNGGTIQGSALQEVTVSGGTGTVSIASAINNASGGVIQVSNRTSGDVTFSGNINSTAGGGISVSSVTGGTVTFSGSSKSFTSTTTTPVLLTGNSGGTIRFTNGGLVINTGTVGGFTAAGGGTITVQGLGNTITTTTGTAVNITSTSIGNDGITFASVTSNGAANGIVLSNVGDGFFTATSGSITNVTNRGLRITDGSGNVSIGASITTSGTEARSVEITGHTAGAVEFSGSITDTSLGMSLDGNTGGTYDFITAAKTFNTGANTAVSLTNNTGATINFKDGNLFITTSTGIGFNATGGGTVTVQGTGSTITSTTGTALNVANTNIGLSGLTFQRITSTGAASGIILNNTGTIAGVNGGLTVTGDAGSTVNATGGTITASSGAGISITSARDINLDQMTIQNGLGDGILGTTVTNFTLTNSTVTNNGDALQEHGVQFDNLLGNGVFTNVTFSNNETSQVTIINTSGTADVAFSNVSLSSTGLAAAPNGLHGIHMETQGTAAADLRIVGSAFNNFFSNSIHATNEGTGTFEITIATSTFNNIGASAINIAQNNSGTVRFNVNNNPTFLRGTNNGVSNSININQAGGTPAGAVLEGRINNNVIGNNTSSNSASTGGYGIQVLSVGSGTTTVQIDHNNIQGTAGGIRVQIGEDPNVAHTINATINDNTILQTDANSVNGIRVNIGTTSAGGGDQGTGRINMFNNTSTMAGAAAANFGNAISVSTRFNTSLLMPGYTGSFNDLAAVQTYLDTTKNNNASGGNPWDISTDAAPGGFFNTSPAGSAIPLPTLPSPLLLAPGGAPATGGNSVLTQTSLNTLGNAAISLWSGTGLTAQQVSVLNDITFSIAELPTGYLGEALPGMVLLSNNAAGNAWFIDTTPFDNSEFTGDGLSLTATSTGGAAGQVDALTVIMHELGHVLGFPDGYGSGIGGPLMEGHLGTGQRFLPQPGSVLSLPASDVEQRGPLPLYFQASPASIPTAAVKSPVQETSYVPRVNARMFRKQGVSAVVYPVSAEMHEILPIRTLRENGLLIIPSFAPAPFEIMEPHVEDSLLPPWSQWQGASAFLQWSAPESERP